MGVSTFTPLSKLLGQRLVMDITALVSIAYNYFNGDYPAVLRQILDFKSSPCDLRGILETGPQLRPILSSCPRAREKRY